MTLAETLIAHPEVDEKLLASISESLSRGPAVHYEIGHSGRRMTRRRYDKMMTTVTRHRRTAAICRRGKVIAYVLPLSR